MTANRETIRALSGARLNDTANRKSPGGDAYDHRFIASTDRLASDRGVILVDAWRWDEFMRRPRWIANHDIGGSAPLNHVALGRVVWVGVENGLPAERVGPSGMALTAYVKYASTPFAQEVRVLYQEGGLDDVSVRWDWRTEQLRDPTETERQVYGDDLAWVATRADLIELSAVLLGADPGAQALREDLEAAVERVRTSTGRRLPFVEDLIRRSRTVVTNPGSEAGVLDRPFFGYPSFSACVESNGHLTNPHEFCAALQKAKPFKATHAADVASPLDVMGVAELVDAGRAAVNALTAWHDAFGAPRQTLSDIATLLGNLVATAAPQPTDADGSEAPKPSEEWAKVSQANVLFHDALLDADKANRASRAAISALRAALDQIAEGAGVGPIDWEARGKAGALDWDAVATALDVDEVLASHSAELRRWTEHAAREKATRERIPLDTAADDERYRVWKEQRSNR